MPPWRQRVGILAKGFSDWQVAVDLGLDYNMTAEDSPGVTGIQVAGCHVR
jgi:hypothetical protein